MGPIGMDALSVGSMSVDASVGPMDVDASMGYTGMDASMVGPMSMNT